MSKRGGAGARDGSLVDPLLDALAATGPDAALADELALFGRFVGAWDVDVTNHRDDGSTNVHRGEWLWGWILEGRAVADVWTVPPRADRNGAPPLEYGATIRFYDAELGAWRVVWNGPMRGRQIVFVARPRGDEIVLEGREGDERVEWIFSEIREHEFRWRAQMSRDDGETWTLVQEMRGRRRC